MFSGGDAIDIFLQPGEYFVGDSTFRLRTLLGSCVSITLWHAEKRIGAMSHFLLPSRRNPVDQELDGRYGDEALCLMIKELQQLGVRPQQCEAKIFGGGNMFPKQGRNHPHIGRKNGETAQRLLALHQIPVVSESLFGEGHRQIIFDLTAGDVWVRQIKPSDRGSSDLTGF